MAEPIKGVVVAEFSTRVEAPAQEKAEKPKANEKKAEKESEPKEG